ncbi:hypothetical protein M1446_00570 [Candidatus Dependentiae bacterium]|nr:hypothetical protein [Candidatus Dependentiae bacterium]
MKKNLYILLLCLFGLNLNAFIAPINLFRPYDILLLPPKHPCNRLALSIGYEGSLEVKGFQEICQGERTFTRQVHPLQIYQCEQDALAALKGFPVDSSVGQLSQLFNIDDDNKTHGLFIPSGCFKVNANVMFGLRYYLPHDFIIGLFLPYFEMELKNVKFTEVEAPTFEAQVPQANNLLQQVEQIGCLSLDGWKRRGVGDLTLQAMWLRDFPQAKPWLENVRVNAQFGMIFPTGKHTNVNELLAIPFGNDGGWGFMLGAGLDLRFLNYLRFGANADFMPLFGNTRCRRIKIDRSQTDLFLVNKTATFKHFGVTNYFTLYGDITSFCRRFSFRIAYEFMQHDRDKIFPHTDKINAIIANAAESLQEFTNHSLIFFLNYDAQKDCCNYPVRPFISTFYKLGFDGKRSMAANTLGFMFTLNF